MGFILTLTEVSAPLLPLSKLCGLGPVTSSLSASALDHFKYLITNP